MSAGLQWDEWTYSYNDSRNDVNGLINSPDWMKYMLDLPVIYVPGSIFTYNSGCTMLLSGIIKNSTGISAKDFAVQNLFTPLGIVNYIWSSGPNDITNTGWGLQLKPRDMLKLGLLFLQKGNWNGEQLLSENWINYSTNTKISISNTFEYACQWWRIKNSSSFGNVLLVNDVFFADGWGGQFILVVPHLDMVAVSTGGNFETGNEALYFFRDYILPAAYSVQSEIAILNSSLTEN
jgi:CubicO group peptidase (beta-lactamase class C family)